VIIPARFRSVGRRTEMDMSPEKNKCHPGEKNEESKAQIDMNEVTIV